MTTRSAATSVQATRLAPDISVQRSCRCHFAQLKALRPTRRTATDEGIRFDATREGIGAVKLLQDGGRHTAATASQICDGAAALLVVNEHGLKLLGTSAKPLARIHQMTVLGHDPVIMLEAPIPATPIALRKAGLRIDDIDLFEINEAFASVPLAWLKATRRRPGAA